MITLKQYGRWYMADTQTPISLFLGIVGQGEGILLESSEVDGRLGRYSLLAWDFRLVLSCERGTLRVLPRDAALDPLLEFDGAPFMDGLRQAMAALTIVPESGFAELPPMTRSLCGYLGYGLCSHFEPCLAQAVDPAQAETTLVLPGQAIVFDHLFHRCAYLSLDPDSTPKMTPTQSGSRCHVGPISSSPDKGTYTKAVVRAREAICQGEAIQVVLSTRFSADFSGDPFELYRRLRMINPSPYTFFMSLPGIQLLGSSPELLVRCRDGRLQLRPIAGTRPRGQDEVQDGHLAQELLADPKERAEHVMLVDLGRNDLGRLARPGTVSVDKFMVVERFSHVMHLTSYLSAEIMKDRDHLDILAAVFPAGTVSGAPKIRAMEIIAELENMDRGPYAGAIGWLGLDKDAVQMDTGITIRSMWIRDGRLHWQAGAGIVMDSDPEKEWQECNNKARAVAQAITSREAGDDFTY
ncbi:MAG: anthranilate synthase component I family protein [Deltaproteobacteria bacterium]|nr:anthranilate synthase component I family protein [Deltaproteobacteria bacterium]